MSMTSGDFRERRETGALLQNSDDFKRWREQFETALTGPKTKLGQGNQPPIE